MTVCPLSDCFSIWNLFNCIMMLDVYNVCKQNLMF